MMHTIGRVGGVLLVVCCVGACGPQAPGKGRASDGTKAADSNVPVAKPVAKAPMDVGDVEVSLPFTGTLAPQSAAPNVKADEMIDGLNRLAMTTITVTPPAPKQLFVVFRVAAKRGFPDAPVVIRGKVFRDKTELTTFSTVLGADAVAKPYEQTVDVLAGLNEAPETLLAHAQAVVILLPAGADPAKVDAANVQGSADTTGALVSNPVRINFGAEK